MASVAAAAAAAGVSLAFSASFSGRPVMHHAVARRPRVTARTTVTAAVPPSVKASPGQVKPNAQRVLVRIDEQPAATAGGVLLPSDSINKMQRFMLGEVVAIAEDVKTTEFQPGSKILVPQLHASEVALDDDAQYVMVKAEDILATVS
eukprot:jgi/Chlat1/2524/Chrsp175S02380